MSIKRLSATDGIWLSLESPDMPMHVAFLLEFTAPDGDAARYVRRWRAQFTAPVPVPQPWNLAPVPGPLGRLLALVRETDEIDPLQHIHSRRLTRVGDRQELVELATRIHREQLNPARPQWEIHIVEGLAADRFAVILKVHHSLFDGASLMRLFTDTYSEDPEDRDTPELFSIGRAQSAGEPHPDAPAPAEQPLPNPLTSKPYSANPLFSSNPLRALLIALRGVLELVRGIGSAARDALRRRRGRRDLPQRAYQQPHSIFDGPITGGRDLSLRRYDLARFKQLAKAADCTINDIVLYLVGTALREYLGEHAELPQESLTAGVPMDLREQDDDRVGTRAGMMFTALATDVDDPLERLAAVRAYIGAAKGHMADMSPNAVIGYGLGVTLPWILGLSWGFDRTPASHPMGISNVPGPRNPLYWNGARLEALYPISLLMHGNPFNVTCVGYNGALHFGVLGASDSLPPMEYLTQSLDAALDELTALLLPAEERVMPSAG
ncbi:wax ester/triacylglycerol synthase family O-acyltransferase [Nocardia huaxiensis]|uniref:Diacylglycerol O-acyltransferase n=1 Tax=Nocardia huaxiensis TaxID=2755382 RepID=A0A7D6V8P9_9NOCA|nr:wax ester/triacylglycerol synthase family O-acyltransferase [Nocardia huaxiensis]QLY30321.1 wax ester/triacylglycerol synthase family O-acyltransferase [Nocardia huaxiensis]UFS96045.1 wax ester/triacylglycerol synthase family O-acyltransferase [Nocardia huaxiensis]